MRNSETLRDFLFKQIEGLQAGTVKPETAKAAASCAMAICKSVDLDLRASEIFKSGGGSMSPLQLTGTDDGDGSVVGSAPAAPSHIDDNLRALVLKGHDNGLEPPVIAKRVGIDQVDVELIIETRQAA